MAGHLVVLRRGLAAAYRGGLGEQVVGEAHTMVDGFAVILADGAVGHRRCIGIFLGLLTQLRVEKVAAQRLAQRLVDALDPPGGVPALERHGRFSGVISIGMSLRTTSPCAPAASCTATAAEVSPRRWSAMPCTTITATVPVSELASCGERRAGTAKAYP
jgi:hypothetical protein